MKKLDCKIVQRPLKYEEIKNAILNHIYSGELPPGSRLPPERQLAERFNCNFHTVRHALKSLKEQNIIVRRVGSGTFINQPEGRITPVKPPPGAHATAQLGVIFQPALADDYAWKILEHLNRRAQTIGIAMNLRMVTALDNEAIQSTVALRDQGCRAIILPWFGSQPVTTMQNFVRNSVLPVVLPDLVAGLEKNCFQSPDIFGEGDYAIIEAQCRYLQALGYRKIALLGPDKINTNPFQCRLMGYSRFVNNHNLSALIGLVDDTPASVAKIIERWQPDIPGLAVITYDDTLAFRLIAGLHKFGIKIPEAVAVVGSNDSAECLTCDPPLTSVCAPYDFAAEHLIDHALALGNGNTAQTTLHAPITFALRESCGETRFAADALAKILQTIGLNTL